MELLLRYLLAIDSCSIVIFIPYHCPSNVYTYDDKTCQVRNRAATYVRQAHNDTWPPSRSSIFDSLVVGSFLVYLEPGPDSTC